MHTIKFVLTAALAFSANMANADHHEGCQNMNKADFSMKGMDTNNDGAISSAEYLTASPGETAENFKHVDANSDGKLDAKEQKNVEEVLKSIHDMPAKAPTATM